MTSQSLVGTPSATSLGVGTVASLRGGNQGDLIVGQSHGRHYEPTYRGQRFGGASQAVLATATIAGLNASITGAPVLYNPAGSGVNLVIDAVGVAFVLTPAAPLAYGLASGWSATAPTGTFTSMKVTNKLLGSAVLPQGQLVTSAAITLPTTPIVNTVLGVFGTGAVTTVGNQQGYYDLAGRLVLSPGGYVNFWTSAILLASSLLFSIEWEEVPV